MKRRVLERTQDTMLLARNQMLPLNLLNLSPSQDRILNRNWMEAPKVQDQVLAEADEAASEVREILPVKSL